MKWILVFVFFLYTPATWTAESVDSGSSVSGLPEPIDGSRHDFFDYNHSEPPHQRRRYRTPEQNKRLEKIKRKLRSLPSEHRNDYNDCIEYEQTQNKKGVKEAEEACEEFRDGNGGLGEYLGVDEEERESTEEAVSENESTRIASDAVGSGNMPEPARRLWVPGGELLDDDFAPGNFKPRAKRFPRNKKLTPYTQPEFQDDYIDCIHEAQARDKDPKGLQGAIEECEEFKGEKGGIEEVLKHDIIVQGPATWFDDNTAVVSESDMREALNKLQKEKYRIEITGNKVKLVTMGLKGVTLLQQARMHNWKKAIRPKPPAIKLKSLPGKIGKFGLKRATGVVGILFSASRASAAGICSPYDYPQGMQRFLKRGRSFQMQEVKKCPFLAYDVLQLAGRN